MDEVGPQIDLTIQSSNATHASFSTSIPNTECNEQIGKPIVANRTGPIRRIVQSHSFVAQSASYVLVDKLRTVGQENGEAAETPRVLRVGRSNQHGTIRINRYSHDR